MFIETSRYGSEDGDGNHAVSCKSAGRIEKKMLWTRTLRKPRWRKVSVRPARI